MNIILVSDTHLTPRSEAFASNWRVVSAWIAAAAPDLVVHLGDITADGAHDPKELEAARTTFATVSAPMRFLPGNHDIGDNPNEVGVPNEHPLDPGRLADYRRLFGSDWWAFDHGAWRIIGLDAQLFATGSDDEEEQFAWLEEQLRPWRGPLGLMLHKPLFRNGRSDTELHHRYVPPSSRRRLFALLEPRDLRFVASGHVHQLRRLQLDGVEHAWTPSTAYYLPDTVQERIGEKVVGLMTLELTEAAHRFVPVTPEGVAQHDILDHPQVYPKLAAKRGVTSPPHV